jgi:hypothetical protein
LFGFGVIVSDKALSALPVPPFLFSIFDGFVDINIGRFLFFFVYSPILLFYHAFFALIFSSRLFFYRFSHQAADFNE